MLGGQVRTANLTNLPGLDEFLERSEGLSEGGLWVGHVELEEVEVVGTEASERSVAALDDVVPLRTPTAVGHRHTPLGGDDRLAPATLERSAQLELALAVAPAVGVGGVEEGDASVEGGVDHGVGGGLVETLAEVIAAEPNRRDRQCANGAKLHGIPLVATHGSAALA